MHPAINALVGFAVCVTIVGAGICVYTFWRSLFWDEARIIAMNQNRMKRYARMAGLVVTGLSVLGVLWLVGRVVIGGG